MGQRVEGDLEVCRTITARRADLGLQETPALAAALNIERHSAFYQRVSTDDLGVENVILPDATTLPEGWSMLIDNFGATDSLLLKDDGLTTLHTVGLGICCIAYLVDNATSDGVWKIHCLNETVDRHCEDFLIAAFAALAGGYHTFTLTAATHGKGATPIYQVEKKTGTDHDFTLPDRIRVANNGDIEIRVTGDDGETPDIDCRFDGRICVI